MLNNCKLTLSDAQQYNDPFELLPASSFLPKEDLSSTKLKKLTEDPRAKSLIEDWGIEDLLQPFGLGTIATSLLMTNPFLALVGAGLYWGTQTKDEKFTYKSELEGLTIFLKQCRPIIDRAKLCCFSAEPNNILMWAHYAQNHEGVAISFRKDAYLWNDEIFKKVEYQESRLPLPSATTDIIRYVGDLMTRKASCWTYEQEWRLIKFNAQDKMLPVNPKAITAIRVGQRMSREKQEKILRIRDTKYPNVPVLKASLNSYEYKIDFEQL